MKKKERPSERLFTRLPARFLGLDWSATIPACLPDAGQDGSGSAPHTNENEP